MTVSALLTPNTRQPCGLFYDTLSQGLSVQSRWRTPDSATVLTIWRMVK